MNCYKLLAVTTFLITVTTQAEQSINGTNLQGTLKDLLNKLIPSDKTLLFVYEKSNEDCLDAMRATHHPRLIIDLDLPIMGYHYMTYTYIICSKNRKWLKKSLKQLVKLKLYNKNSGPRQRYFLITDGRANLQLMAKAFLKHKITKLTVLQRLEKFKFINESSNKPMIPFHSALPYYKVINDAINIPKIQEIEIKFPGWISGKYKDPNSNIKFHIMYEAAKMIAKTLDVGISYTHAKTCTKNTLRHICMAVHYTYEYTNELPDYEISDCFLYDVEVFFIPRVTKTNRNQSMIFVFSWSAFILLVAIFLFFVTLCWLMARFLNERFMLQRFGSWMLISIQYLFGFPTSILPRSHTLRVLLFFYIFYCFQLSFMYQTAMTSVLTEPGDEPEVESLEQLSETNIAMLIERYQASMLKKLNKVMYEKLKDRFVYRPDSVHIDKRLDVAIKNNYVTYMNKELFPYIYPEEFAKFYELKYYVFMLTSLSYRIPRGHYFYDKLNQYQRRILEGGFQQKILEDARKKYTKRKVPPDEPENIYLEFKHLKEVFLFWIFGMSVATIAFLGELFSFYCWRRILDWLRKIGRHISRLWH